MNLAVRYINLDRREDRNTEMINKLSSVGICDYERFSAIDGTKITMPDEIFKNNCFSSRRGIMGCALSHINLWKELANSDYDYYLILEDDIIFAKDFPYHYNYLLTEIGNTVYPFIFLGLTNPSRNVIEKNTLEIIPFNNDDVWGGAFGYIIYRDLAKYFLEYIDKYGLQYPIDVFIMEQHKNYNIQMFETSPLIISSLVMMHENNVDSDIQYDMMTPNDNFIFYQGKDSPGNDLFNTSAMHPIDMKKIALMVDECVAFNTLGYYKSLICHPDNFIDIPRYKQPYEGLYVKKID